MNYRYNQIHRLYYSSNALTSMAKFENTVSVKFMEKPSEGEISGEIGDFGYIDLQEGWRKTYPAIGGGHDNPINEIETRDQNLKTRHAIQRNKN